MTSVRQGYKKTDVGIIPEDWFLLPISGVTFTVKPPVKLESIEYLTTGDYPIITQGMELITAYCNEESYLVEAGNYILFGDHTCFVKRYSGAFAQGADGLKILRVNNNRVLFNFCYYSFNYYAPKPTGYNRHWSSAKNTLLATPSKINEQQAIASALSDMDALIEAKEALLEKKRAIKQGAMQELLTGKRRLPGFPVTPMKHTEIGDIPEDWALLPISTVTASVRPPIKLEATSYLSVGDYPVITQGAEPITAYCNEVSYLVEEGNYILFGDHTCYVKRHCGSFAQGADGLKILRIKQNCILFDFCYYSFDYCSPKPTGYNRHWTSAKKTLLPTPSKRYEQQAIATVLSDMDAEIQSLEQEIAKLRDLKQGMMQELLTGRIRLV